MTYKIKNQNELPGAKADCTIYTMVTIFELTYGIVLPSTIAEQLSIKAQQEGVLFADDGANFDTIYGWMAEIASEQTGLNIKVSKSNVNSDTFKNRVEEGFYYGLGLYMGNNTYLEYVRNGFISHQSIDNIKIEGVRWSHNNCFGVELQGQGTSILEIARGQEVDCDIETLIYGADQGVFWYPARTFIGGDDYSKLTLNYLQQVNHKRLIVKPEFTDAVTEEEKKALNHASELNKKFYIDTSYKPKNNL